MIPTCEVAVKANANMRHGIRTSTHFPRVALWLVGGVAIAIIWTRDVGGVIVAIVGDVAIKAVMFHGPTIATVWPLVPAGPRT